MSAVPSPRRRRRPPTVDPNGYTAAEWERDFRDDVKDSIAMLSETVQRMTLLIEDHNSRLKALEQEPRKQRAQVNSMQQSRATLIGLGGLLMAAITFALQHVSFH